MDGPKTVKELQTALNNAVSGDTIYLLPIDYKGDFTLKAKNPSDKITLIGQSDPEDSKSYTKIFGSGTVFKILKGSWTIMGLSIKSGNVGVEMNGIRNTVKSCTFSELDTGVVILGDYNIVSSSNIYAKSIGILVNGSNNLLKSDSIDEVSQFGVKVESGNANKLVSLSINKEKDSRGGKSIYIGENSSDGEIKSCNLDGIMDLKGNNYRIKSISCQGGLNLYGCGNILSTSTIKQFYATTSCLNDFSGKNYNSIMSKSNSPIIE